jgi:phosphoribosylformylglycinamidine synthase
MTRASASTKAAKSTSGKNDVQLLCLAVVPQAGFSTKTGSVSFPLYWVQQAGSDRGAESDPKLIEALEQILVDPLQERLLQATPEGRQAWTDDWSKQSFRWWCERQFQPGVTDNLAHTVKEALSLKGVQGDYQIASGTGFLLSGKGANPLDTLKSVEQFSRYRYFHPLTDCFKVHDLASKKTVSDQFLSFPAVHLPTPKPAQTVALNLDDKKLEALSRQRLLALSLSEMQAIRKYFEQAKVKKARKAKKLPEWPTDVELEIIAQTWSEHCKHKIFNATITHTDLAAPGAPQTEQIKSLYKSYIQAATRKLAPERPDLLSVFEDNSGVVSWDDDWAVCFKVETHNSPSALEPYGGALTGILGVNRDILGTGLGAKPIFNTDVFCFAYPSEDLPDRPKLLPAETILNGVRKGVEDGGNKSGIPTVNGAIYFHPGYRAKPLVFCGTGGILPRSINGVSAIQKHTSVKDIIVMAGGRVGKDGVHGATFSSESLHEGSPVSAVQIGDPFTQKRLLDFTIEARDAGLITGITDNGAGGLSSSVGEMARITNGATIELNCVPLKYPGLSDWEIVISESQERMTISTNNFEELQKLASKHNVEVSAIGTFDDSGSFAVTRDGAPVALLDLQFLHDGLPDLELESHWQPIEIVPEVGPPPRELSPILISLLSHQNVCSRESVIRQYDHEVQGMSVIKPLMGPFQQAPCDAAVQKPRFDQDAGLVISNGLCPQLSRFDTHLMAVCAVDEAVRNAICVGADPATIAILDNFCWPDPVASARNPDGKYKLGQLVRACKGLFEAAVTYKAPLISGKDSMKNDFDDGVLRLSIPPTLLVSLIARLPNIGNAVSMEFKGSGDLIYLLAAGKLGLAGSQYEELQGWRSDWLPSLDLAKADALYRRVFHAIRSGWVRSCHDLSEGGLGVALAECVIGSKLGARIDADRVLAAAGIPAGTDANAVALNKRIDLALFAEGPGRLVVSVDPAHQRSWETLFEGYDCYKLGVVEQMGRLRVLSAVGKPVLDMTADGLAFAWKPALPFDRERQE